ncbi:hypothetical protein [uncultured Gammaproteobacteria bacterium]|nr:hypothetical protein [uncultured Gammaproteobacteria bacterium]
MTDKLVVGLAGVLCVVFVAFAQYVDRALVCCYVLLCAWCERWVRLLPVS